MRMGWLVASLAALVACGDDTGGDGGVGGSGAGGTTSDGDGSGGSGSTGAGAGGGGSTGATTASGSTPDHAAADAYWCNTACACRSLFPTVEECYQDCAQGLIEARADYADGPCVPELDAYTSCLGLTTACVDGNPRQDPTACRAEQDAVSACQSAAGTTGSG